MSKRKFWIWVDGQKRYYDCPPEPPGYTAEQLLIAQQCIELSKREASR